MKLWLFIVAATILVTTSSAQIPDRFFDSWELYDSENYDAYLEAKGYSWIVRWVIERSSCTRTFTARPDNTFQLIIETPRSRLLWDNVQLGVPFEGDYLDDTKHMIRFDYIANEPARLIETHEKRSGEKESYQYRIGDDGNLFMVLEYKGVVAKRFYKRTSKQ